MNQPFSPALAGTTPAPQATTRPRDISARRAVSLVERPRPVARDRRGLRYRLNVAARVFTGSIGAYGVVATLGMVLARTLPMARAEAVMTATLVALLLFPAVTIWAFLTRSPGRALGGVIAATVIFGGIVALLPPPA